MKTVRVFEDFSQDKDGKDLQKIYLAIDPKSGHRWWSYKGFAADNYFIQVTLDNYKDIKINP